MENDKHPRFNPNSPRFRDAMLLAAELHAGQTRKATDIPYIAHLMGVAGLAIEYGANGDEAIAALLHDAAEDCGGKPTLEMIHDRFGEAVADTIDGCTDAYPNANEEKPDWMVRKVKYIAHLRTAKPSVRLISAADKLHNARTILQGYRELEDRVFDRFRKSKYETLWYYRRLADELLALGPRSIAEELNRVVSELENLSIEKWTAEELTEKERVYRRLDKELNDASDH